MPFAMFEGKKIQRRVDAPDKDAARLRELQWAELVAQLAATRDLRCALDRRSDDGGAAGRFKSLNLGSIDAAGHASRGESGMTDRLTPPTVTHRASIKDRDSQ
jgi:hypothetical protein